jgi:MFS family permease
MKGREGTQPDRSSEVMGGPAFKPSLLAVLLVSFSVLVFEVALTRVFSVMLTYHFVFAVISAAMLGLGLGGVLFKRYGHRLSGRAIWIAAVALSQSLAVSLLLILVIPVGGSAQLAGLRLFLYLLLALLPFGAAGFVVSGLFQRFPARSSLLYGADLIGAAAGTLAVVPGMNVMGPVNLVLLTAVIAAVAALLLGCLAQTGPSCASRSVSNRRRARRASRRRPRSGRAHPRRRAQDAAAVLADPAERFRIAESRWSSFGRTDLVESPLYPMQKYLFVDGAAGSIMYDLDAILKDPQAQENLNMRSGESFPFQFLKDEEKQTALILGPGGGQDVVMAILGGVKNITAVEVNPDVVGLVQRYKDFSGEIYSGRPGITAIVAEGRNFVRTSANRYDLIMAAIPVTKSSRSVEGYALTENNLFTVEAFGDYLDHLSDNGRIILVAHNDKEIYRLVSWPSRPSEAGSLRGGGHESSLYRGLGDDADARRAETGASCR